MHIIINIFNIFRFFSNDYSYVGSILGQALKGTPTFDHPHIHTYFTDELFCHNKKTTYYSFNLEYSLQLNYYTWQNNFRNPHIGSNYAAIVFPYFHAY